MIAAGPAISWAGCRRSRQASRPRLPQKTASIVVCFTCPPTRPHESGGLVVDITISSSSTSPLRTTIWALSISCGEKPAPCRRCTAPTSRTASTPPREPPRSGFRRRMHVSVSFSRSGRAFGRAKNSTTPPRRPFRPTPRRASATCACVQTLQSTWVGLGVVPSCTCRRPACGRPCSVGLRHGSVHWIALTIPGVHAQGRAYE